MTNDNDENGQCRQCGASMTDKGTLPAAQAMTFCKQRMKEARQ